MPADDPEFWAKGEAFRRYAKACRMANFNRTVRTRYHHEGLAAVSGNLNEKRARELAEQYPEFPDAFRTYFPREADKAIG